MDGLYLVSGNLKLYRLSGVDVTLLNQTVTGNYDKELPLGIVPMLALRDARLGDINADLTAILGMYKPPFCCS